MLITESEYLQRNDSFYVEELLETLDDLDHGVSFVKTGIEGITIGEELITRKKQRFDTLQEMIDFIIENDVKFIQQSYFYKEYNYMMLEYQVEHRLIYF